MQKDRNYNHLAIYLLLIAGKLKVAFDAKIYQRQPSPLKKKTLKTVQTTLSASREHLLGTRQEQVPSGNRCLPCAFPGQFFHPFDYQVSDLHPGSDPTKTDATMVVKNRRLTVTRWVGCSPQQLCPWHSPPLVQAFLWE